MAAVKVPCMDPIGYNFLYLLLVGLKKQLIPWSDSRPPEMGLK